MLYTHANNACTHAHPSIPTHPPPHTHTTPIFSQSLVCEVHHGDRFPVNTRRGEGGEGGEGREGRGGRGGRKGREEGKGREGRREGGKEKGEERGRRGGREGRVEG